MISPRTILLLLLLACAWSPIAAAKPSSPDMPDRRLDVVIDPPDVVPPAEPKITPHAHDEGLAIAEKLRLGMTPEEVEPILGKFDRFSWPLIKLLREKCQQGPSRMELEVRVGAVAVSFAAGDDRIVRAKSIQVLPANQDAMP